MPRDLARSATEASVIDNTVMSADGPAAALISASTSWHTLQALPFYVVQVAQQKNDSSSVAFLLGAQTAGAARRYWRLCGLRAGGRQRRDDRPAGLPHGDIARRPSAGLQWLLNALAAPAALLPLAGAA